MHAENLPRLQRAGGKREQRRAAAPHAAPGDAGAADDVLLLSGEHRALQAARARVGHQHDAPAARDQFRRQRLGGEEMPAGAAGGDHDGLHRRSPHDASP